MRPVLYAVARRVVQRSIAYIDVKPPVLAPYVRASHVVSGFDVVRDSDLFVGLNLVGTHAFNKVFVDELGQGNVLRLEHLFAHLRVLVDDPDRVAPVVLPCFFFGCVGHDALLMRRRSCYKKWNGAGC